MQPVYVAGVGMTKFGRDPRTLAEIFREAATSALRASELDSVDALYIGVMNPEEFTGDSNIASLIADAVALTGIPALRIETASSAGAAALMAGFQAIASGYYHRVMILAGEKMTHLSTSATTRVLAGVIDKRERQCGATMPALAAMITQKYRQQARLSEARLGNMLCGVALKNHANGVRNPFAQFQRAISREAYFESKFVATPLRLYDCAPITDGAAAVVLTSEKTDVCLPGIGQGTGTLSLQDRQVFTSFPSTKIAAARAYRMADIAPQNIDFAEVHDAFTPFEIISTEDLGFFPAGKGGEAVLEGKTAVDGPLPINPSGGLKARGHPVGGSGLAQVIDVVKTLRGEGAVRREFKRGLAQSTGGLATNNFVTIAQRTDAPTVQNLWAGAGTANGAHHTAVAPTSNQQAEEGVIETFTLVYVTPDGFLSPLALALIRTPGGALLMAQGEDDTPLKIGQEVSLRRMDGISLFRVKGQIRKVQDTLMKWFRRKPVSVKGPAKEAAK
jgi:acetyl-CoA acetyltransferase